MNAAYRLVAIALALVPLAAVLPQASFLAPVLGPAGDPLDEALDGDRSLLSFLPEDVRSGRFAFRVRPRSDGAMPAPRWSGVFWRTESGNAYTRTEPYDEELVRREVTKLMEHERREVEQRPPRPSETPRPDPPDPANALPLLRGRFYGGSEYQWSLADAVFPYVQARVLISSSGACDAALDVHAEAVRRAVNALDPEFRPAGERDRWTIDLLPLRRETAGTRERAELACEGEDEVGGLREDPATFVVERWSRGVALRALDSDGGPDGAEHRIDVVPGDVGAPPAVPRPAPRDDDVLNDFLLAVAACRGLPFEYTNFAAANSYHPPYTLSYDGPSVLSTEWVCEKDVPPGANVQD